MSVSGKTNLQSFRMEDSRHGKTAFAIVVTNDTDYSTGEHYTDWVFIGSYGAIRKSDYPLITVNGENIEPDMNWIQRHLPSLLQPKSPVDEVKVGDAVSYMHYNPPHVETGTVTEIVTYD